MKFVCPKKDLLNGLSTVLKAISPRTTLTVLQSILIHTVNDELKLVGNDLELGIETIVSAEIIEAGSIIVNSKIFSEIIRKLPDNDVTIVVDSSHLMNITCEKSEFNIPCQGSEEYILLPTINKNTPLLLKQHILKNMIYKTLFSVASEDIRPILTGGNFIIDNNVLTAVTIDGFRASVSHYSLEKEYDDLSIIIPGKTLSELHKILSDEEQEEMAIYFDDKHVLFEFDKTLIVSRLMVGDFPNYKNIFISDYETKIIADTHKLFQSVERGALIANESKKKPIRLNIKEDHLVIYSNTEVGKVHDEIPIVNEGKTLEIAFNPKYLLDVLKVMDDQEVVLRFNSPVSPCIIKDSKQSEYLILPIRVEEE